MKTKVKMDKAYLEKIKSLSFKTGAPAKTTVKEVKFGFAGIIRIPCGPKRKGNDEEAFSA